jgi:hypothetical protein
METHPPGTAASQSRTMIELIELSAECKCMAVKLHPSFVRQYENVEKMKRLPEYLQDASIDEKYMYMQRKKLMFQEMASSIRLSLSDGLASASAPAIGVVSTPDPCRQFWDPKRISDKKEMPESYLKKRKRAPLVAQVEALTPDTIRAGIAASLSDVRILPIDWAQSSLVQARQKTYLSFGLFLMKHTGAAVNSPFIEQQYTAFREAQREQTVWSVETVSKNWFSNHPVWLPVLWKHAGVAPATNTQEFLRCSLEEASKPSL